jgi:DNA (cytosine-5)-methyltransferase 1
VFVVGHLGDWRRAAAVLFERESVFGNPPTRRKAWEGVARSTAASLTSSGRGVERCGESRGQDDVVLGRPIWRGGDQANSEHCIDHAGTLNCDKWQQGGVIAFHPTQDPISSVDGSTHAMGCGSKGGCCTQAVAFQSNLGTRGGDIYEDGSSQPLRTVAPPAVAFKPSHYTRGKDGAPSEVAAPLSADADKGDQDTVVAQGFTYSGYSNQPAWMTGDRTDCLPASGHSDGSHQGVGVAIGFDGFQSGNPKATHQATEEGAGPLIRNRPHCVATPMAVRRLTPRECERLQGFPDDYTLVEYRKKPAADGPRYRALGNSMAVPVMRWIGERIAMVDRMT